MAIKVLIAMSGGVDSAVAAHIIRQNGFDAVAATMKIGQLYCSDEYENCCCSDQNITDAKAMAQFFGIEHYTVDLTDAFRQHVSDNFIQTYLNGATPNPCIECNRHIKFGRLLDYALELGAQKIATGHYADVREQDGRYLLFRAADPAKDQTYMLWQLTQHQLAHAMFPLAKLSKETVREIAAELGIVAATKKDSQDICFIPDGEYAKFIRNATNVNLPEGNFVDADGNVLGKHQGIIHYTPGQRKGLGITFGQPMYVKSKSAADNSVILCKNEELFSTKVTAHKINLISCDSISDSLRVTAKIRYSQKEEKATVFQTSDDEIVLEFDNPQRAVSPGQSVVMYDGNTVVGGGIIK